MAMCIGRVGLIKNTYIVNSFKRIVQQWPCTIEYSSEWKMKSAEGLSHIKLKTGSKDKSSYEHMIVNSQGNYVFGYIDEYKKCSL